jgi:hypothetical protein
MDDDDAFFVLDQHPFFQSVGKHVALLGHIILTFGTKKKWP